MRYMNQFWYLGAVESTDRGMNWISSPYRPELTP
jgi:hypothetical protein